MTGWLLLPSNQIYCRLIVGLQFLCLLITTLQPTLLVGAEMAGVAMCVCLRPGARKLLVNVEWGTLFWKTGKPALLVSIVIEPSLEHRVLCLALCVSDSAQPAELPQ